MRYSKYYIPTLKESPAEAEVVSHKLMLRAGMIRKLTSGVYTFLPLGLKTLNKVAAIVREEMNRAGALEMFMPTVQPADLWQESGRWEFYGKELLRFTDRHGRDCCLGPTHEEVITDLLRGEVRSYRQLPLNLYQIQTKFRDEIRPRFGLMRGREFIMKDAYSFDASEEGANASYQAMYDAYTRIFSRLGMRFRAVEADSGTIGGNFSHEFMVLADTGEDTIAVCQNCSYAANLEKAPVVGKNVESPASCAEMEEVLTPDQHTVQEVAAFLQVAPDAVIKTLLYETSDGRSVAALVAGDREVNEVKLRHFADASDIALAAPKLVREWSGAPVGFAGPVGLKVDVLVADSGLRGRSDFVAGANKKDTHVRHLDLARDVPGAVYTDLCQITESDPCPLCGGKIELPRGIEVGHVFKLGTKYSQAMNAIFLDENGTEHPMIMGCYGIGVSRVVAACIEQNHDESGMIFPPPIAPFEVVLLDLGGKDEAVSQKAEELYDELRKMGVDVLFDDRKERPGVKFNDADLLGIPLQIVLGGKGLKNGVVEAKDRRSGEKTELSFTDFAATFTAWKKQVYTGWNLEKQAAE